MPFKQELQTTAREALKGRIKTDLNERLPPTTHWPNPPRTSVSEGLLECSHTHSCTYCVRCFSVRWQSEVVQKKPCGLQSRNYDLASSIFAMKEETSEINIIKIFLNFINSKRNKNRCKKWTWRAKDGFSPKSYSSQLIYSRCLVHKSARILAFPLPFTHCQTIFHLFTINLSAGPERRRKSNWPKCFIRFDMDVAKTKQNSFSWCPSQQPRMDYYFSSQKEKYILFRSKYFLTLLILFCIRFSDFSELDFSKPFPSSQNTPA